MRMNKINLLQIPPKTLWNICARGGDTTRWEWAEKLNELTNEINKINQNLSKKKRPTKKAK